MSPQATSKFHNAKEDASSLRIILMKSQNVDL